MAGIAPVGLGLLFGLGRRRYGSSEEGTLLAGVIAPRWGAVPCCSPTCHYGMVFVGGTGHELPLAPCTPKEGTLGHS